MRKSLFFLISFLLIFSFPVHANWTFKGWFGGGCFPFILAHPTKAERIYVTSDINGIWRSDNGANEWKDINQGLGHFIVASLAIDPQDTEIIYAATGGGLFISRNGGDLWESTNNPNNEISFIRPQNYRPIAIDPTDSKHICVGTSKGKVFCSRNYGKSWENHTETYGSKDGLPIAALLFNPEGQLISSAQISIPNETFIITDLIYVPAYQLYFVAGDKQLWFSSDLKQWESSNAVNIGQFNRLSFDSKSAEPILYAAINHQWQGHLFKSTNKGKTWESIAQPCEMSFFNMKSCETYIPDLERDPTRAWAASKGKTASLIVDPNNPQVLYKTDWWGIWKSIDGGQTWQERINGAANTVATDISFDEKTGNMYIATMDNGLLVKSPESSSYAPLFPKNGYADNINGHVWRVHVSNNRIVATSSPWAKRINQILIKEPDSDTFLNLMQGLPQDRPKQNTMWGQGYPRALAVSPHDPMKIYLGIDGDDGGGLYVSSDGGYHWEKRGDGLGSLRVFRGLLVDPLDSTRIFWAACASKGGVYVSTDDGQHFKQSLTQMSWVFDLAASPDGTIYAAGQERGAALYQSKDHGQHWQKIHVFDPDLALSTVTVHPKNPHLIAVSTHHWSSKGGGHIYLSRDSGENWEDITSDLPLGSGASAMAFSPVDNSLYITRYAASVYRYDLDASPNK